MRKILLAQARLSFCYFIAILFLDTIHYMLIGLLVINYKGIRRIHSVIYVIQHNRSVCIGTTVVSTIGIHRKWQSPEYIINFSLSILFSRLAQDTRFTVRIGKGIITSSHK
ncbi:hypothetical protein Barb7_00193 [Bacteroidales bacterium Barb7]|nr:hypothetical protein Barb7_00193 [Bacteroidales bacterium Barb7]